MLKTKEEQIYERFVNFKESIESSTVSTREDDYAFNLIIKSNRTCNKKFKYLPGKVLKKRKTRI